MQKRFRKKILDFILSTLYVTISLRKHFRHLLRPVRTHGFQDMQRVKDAIHPLQ